MVAFAGNLERRVSTPASGALVSKIDVLLDTNHDGGVQVWGPIGTPSQEHAAGSLGSHVIAGEEDANANKTLPR